MYFSFSIPLLIILNILWLLLLIVLIFKNNLYLPVLFGVIKTAEMFFISSSFELLFCCWHWIQFGILSHGCLYLKIIFLYFSASVSVVCLEQFLFSIDLLTSQFLGSHWNNLSILLYGKPLHFNCLLISLLCFPVFNKPFRPWRDLS